MNMKQVIIFVMTLIVMTAETHVSKADDLRISGIRAKLDSLCLNDPAFSNMVDISVGQMRLSELLRTIAEVEGVNLSVRDNFDCIVSCSFKRSRIDDLIVFLCREYSLDIEIYGNIVSIFRYLPPPEIAPPIEIKYSLTDSLINFRFHEKPLSEFAETLTASTGVNVIVPKELRTLNVSGVAVNVSISDAIDIVAEGNGLDSFILQGKQKIWCFTKKEDQQTPRHSKRQMHNQMSTDTTAILPLHHRSVNNICDLVPEDLKKDVTILTSDEMNSLIVHGSSEAVKRLRYLISRIDVTVPLVSIDVMIVETTKKFTRSIGAKAGKSTGPIETAGTIGGGIDGVIGSSTVTSLLQKIDGFSNVNLGDVAENLYLELKFLENQGQIKLESTPKLATLNGHKASMSKGETMYYKEINTSYLGSQNPLQTSSYNWKSVDADLILDITPHVSLDSLITLEVDLSQSEFGTTTEENAPPPTTKRSFKSIVRVSDGDVVLLGGLDSAVDSDNHDGLPFIARVPVLRWIFGVNKREKSDIKMSIFIRAKII